MCVCSGGIFLDLRDIHAQAAGGVAVGGGKGGRERAHRQGKPLVQDHTEEPWARAERRLDCVSRHLCSQPPESACTVGPYVAGDRNQHIHSGAGTCVTCFLLHMTLSVRVFALLPRLHEGCGTPEKCRGSDPSQLRILSRGNLDLRIASVHPKISK